MYVGQGAKGGSTNVTIPVDLGNDLYLFEVCLHSPKEISCYERTLRNLYATGAISNTVFLHIVPRQCLTKCVYEWKKEFWKKFSLVSGSLFLPHFNTEVSIE